MRTTPSSTAPVVAALALLGLVSGCDTSATQDLAGPALTRGPEAVTTPSAVNPDATTPAVVEPTPLVPAGFGPGGTVHGLTLGKADSYDALKDANPGIYAPTAAPVSPVVASPPWMVKKSVVMAWTGAFPQLYEGVLDAIDGTPAVLRILHDGLASKSAFTAQMAGLGYATDGLLFVDTPLDTLWAGAYGPIVQYDADTATVGFVDPRTFHNRPYDDAVPTALADEFGVHAFRMPLELERHAFTTDAKGTCFISEAVLWRNALPASTVELYLRDYLGCFQVVVLRALDGEPAGALDVGLQLVSATQALVGEYAPAVDPANKVVLDVNAAIIDATVTAGGGSLEVVRMPMPDNSDGLFRSYLTSVLVNGVNLVPTYSDAAASQTQALVTWNAVKPTWAHTLIDATALTAWGGGLSSLVMPVSTGVFSTAQDAPAELCTVWSCTPSDTGNNEGCGSVPVIGTCVVGGTQARWCDGGVPTLEECGAGQSCGWSALAGHFACVAGAACTPSCDGKACGPDGCGGTCGDCPFGDVCVGGSCEVPVTGCMGIGPKGCCDGNHLVVCSPQGALTTQVCGLGCGWDTTGDGGEGHYECGAFGADPTGTYPLSCEAAMCTPDCDGKVCGDDGCGGSCGYCDPGELCDAGSCGPLCAPSCEGKNCGDDGCGGSCGTCTGELQCGEESGQCFQVLGECSGITSQGCCSGSTLQYCSTTDALIGIPCPQGVCGWNAAANWYECGFTGIDPSGSAPLSCAAACTPDCDGKVCGDDGCGGSCGSCSGGQTCQPDGACVCVADCTDKACGSDGCGGSCGECGAGKSCDLFFQCVDDAEPLGCGNLTDVGCCDGDTLKFCDDDELSVQACGSCGWDADGNGGEGWYDCGGAGADPSGVWPLSCETPCVPSCDGKNCGWDGCTGTCGSCGGGETCTAAGVCEASEDCGDVSYEGCCDGDVVTFCDMGTLDTIDCGAAGGCGWDPSAGFYDCGESGQDPTGQNPLACPPKCVPACAGKSCGPDGCGGSCGSCGDSAECTPSGVCVSTCEPQCVGKNCGPDGCGGSCGSCGNAEFCNALGLCQSSTDCGTLTDIGCCAGDVLKWCDGEEVSLQTCNTCGWDADGNGGEGWYDCGFIGEDPSGDNPIECPSLCAPDCTGKMCGDDGCGGSCGDCGFGATCEAGTCLSQCVPDCLGKACGDDGCGGSCGYCSSATICEAGACSAPIEGNVCGSIPFEGICGPGGVITYCTGGQLAVLECSSDCCGWEDGSNIGNNCIASSVCPCTDECQPGESGCSDNGTHAWTCKEGKGNACHERQWTACDAGCDDAASACTVTCEPVCGGKTCGPDACGGVCGTCPTGELCSLEGQCECAPDCGDKTCGDDGCGGTCGECSEGEVCNAGTCACVPQCEGKVCGPDGCGGTCGSCEAPNSCDGGQCVCAPDCDGKACGDDGCGGSCGDCADGQACGEDGQCACVPVCDGLECGDDGCGGSCGSCEGDATCEAGVCVSPVVDEGNEPDAGGADDSAGGADDSAGGDAFVIPTVPEPSSGCGGGPDGSTPWPAAALGLALAAWLARRRRPVH